MKIVDIARIFGCAAFFSISIEASASQAEMGWINSVYATAGGAILFNSTGARTALPACQPSSVPQRFALDGSTVAGQAQIAVLLNAKIQNKRVMIIGSGSCTIWPDTETVSFFLVED